MSIERRQGRSKLVWDKTKQEITVVPTRQSSATVEPLSGAEIESLSQLHDADGLCGHNVECRLLATIRERDAEIARLHETLEAPEDWFGLARLRLKMLRAKEEEIERLHEALRRSVVRWQRGSDDSVKCDLCLTVSPAETETHATGCIAAPREPGK